MKKVLFAAIAVFGLVFNAGAQSKGDVEFGANIGANYAYIGGKDGTSDARFNWNAGIAADYYFSDRWSVKAKLIYDRKGWNDGYLLFGNDAFDPVHATVIYNTHFNLDYLTIPVTANWHFGKKRNWYLHFGPYVGFLVNAKDTRFKNDVKDFFKTTDFGANVGIGVKIPVTDKLKIFVEYDEQAGLTEIYKTNKFSKATNSRGALNVGINVILK